MPRVTVGSRASIPFYVLRGQVAGFMTVSNAPLLQDRPAYDIMNGFSIIPRGSSCQDTQELLM